MIKCLSKEVQGKLRSGVAIFSLQQCVEELVLNSIDAGATCVGVRVDMEACKVQVIDNGSGMDIDNVERVGNRYFTSKCSSLEDLDYLRFYGFRGEAVASIVTLAMLVEITSRTKLSVKTFVKIFKDGKGLDVFEAGTTRPSAGTSVVVCNFFHNMPVRRKRIDAVLESERIRQRVEAISLMHPSVSFTMKNDLTGAMVVQLSKARNTYYRFVQIHGSGKAKRLGEISHSHGQFEVRGHIGKEGHYNNSLQFLYVNERLLLKTRIHTLLNLLLRKVRSSNRKNDSPNTPPAVRSPKQRRGPEQYGVYIINITCQFSEYDICLEPAKTLIEFKDWDGVLFCIEGAVKAFLARENLVVELTPEDIQDYACQNLFSGLAASSDTGEDAKVGRGPTDDGSALGCNMGRTLASEAVHRRLKGGLDTEDNAAGQLCVEAEEKSDRGGKSEEKEDHVKGLEQKQEHTSTNTQCEQSSVERDKDAPQCELTTVAGASMSETRKNITKEEDFYTLMKSDVTSDESIGPLLSFTGRTEDENVKAIQEDRTEIRDNVRLHVPPSTSSVGALCGVTQEIQSNMGLIKQTQSQRNTGVGEHISVGHRKIYLSDPYNHGSLPSQKCTSLQRSQGQGLKCLEKRFAAKRTFPTVEGSGHVQINEGECKNPPSVTPLKMSKVMPCQRLALGLSREAGSLDMFRRIYGKPSESKPLHSTVDVNSNHLPTEATTSCTDHPITSAHNILTCHNDDQESVVMESRLDMKAGCTRLNDHKSPLTLSTFTRLKPVSARSQTKGISLAAKLARLKHQKTDVTSHPSDDDIDPPDTLVKDVTLDIPNGEQTDDISSSCDLTSGDNTNPLLAEEEKTTASSDWLPHYDESLGKLVYINKVTGLSKYEAPAVEETHVACTSDVTNMAVSVISQKGFEYRCYPFQVDLVLPFLPRSKAERVISSGSDNRGDDVQTSNSLSSLYSEWSNPVFVRPPTVAVDISSGQAEGLAVKIHNILFPYRFSKDMIHSMKVIDQVDKKFLACLINTRDPESAGSSEPEGNLLVLLDQHAVHERVRLENLVADSYEEDPDTPGGRRLCSSTIAPPLEIRLTEEELRLLRSCQLRRLGLEVEFPQTGDSRALVGKVPLCFAEKESNEVRRGRPSVVKTIVEEYLQEQIELLRSTGRVGGTLPLAVLKVLASLACHGAIKFNDSLSKDECCSLVVSLSGCQLPFQCAHGRPSIVPLVDTLHLGNDRQELAKPNMSKLRRMYKAWELYGNR